MKAGLLFIIFVIATSSPALARGRSYGYQGGHYSGGHGSSHKGGHYVNARTGNHYTHHQ